MFRQLFVTLSLMSGLLCLGNDSEGTLLNGKPIGCASVDYATGKESTTANTPACAFDGRFDTFYASYSRSFSWVGLELDRPYVITRVGFAARNDSYGPVRMQLGVFQGANEPDFSDAIPIYMIPRVAKIGVMTYVDIDCSRAFKYVRYVGPHDARCNVAELEFYGTASNGDDSHLYQVTNLPLVVVNTPGMEWFKDNNKEYEMNGSNITVIADGTIDVSAPGQIRGRGNASWQFPKKPFRIKFDKKQCVLNSPAKAKKWTMINNYGDKTLMRNKLAFDISEMLGLPFTPVCHFVDLIFNGEYQGTYQLCDQVEVNPGRVEITEMTPEDVDGEALTGGYFIEIDAYANQEAPGEWFTSKGGHAIPVTIKSPDPGITAQYNYIRDHFTKLEQALFSGDYLSDTEGYRRYLNLDSFLKHFIVGELSGNTDTYWSVYMSLERGSEQFQVGPVWDFDLAFDNDYRTYPINNKNDYIYRSGGSCAPGMLAFVNRIIREDRSARSRLSYLWSYARRFQGLNNVTFQTLIDKYEAELSLSQAFNFKRWPILAAKVHQNPVAWGSYTREVENVRNYLSKRFDKLDSMIGIVEVKEDAIDTVEAPIAIKVDGNTVSYEGTGHWQVCNMAGVVMHSAIGEGSVTLPPGLYIVSDSDLHHLKLKI